MASTIFTGTTSVSTPYAATDIYTLALPTSAVQNVSQVGSDVVFQTAAAAFTITGVTLAQLTSANFAIQGGGIVAFGDNTSGTISDQFGNLLPGVTGNANADILLGLGGGDTINGGDGANLIFGGAGFTDQTDGGDQINTGLGNDTIYGNAGADTITSGGGSDLVYGGAGGDTIIAGALTGNASLYGGGSFTDTTDGADNISVTSNSGSLFITGNAGNDTISVGGSTGNVSVYGGNGADGITVAASAGNVLISGGSFVGNTDVDTIVYNATGSASATIFGGSSETDANDGVDNITVNGSTNTGTTVIYGNAGNDQIVLNTAGNSTIQGGSGADVITYTGQNAVQTAVIYGGVNTTGNDVINVASFAGEKVTVFGGSSITDSADGADSITGGAGNELIYGNGGNDTILSGAGSDTIFGGAGDDLFVINGQGSKAVSDFGNGTDTALIDLTATGAFTTVNTSASGVQLANANTTLTVSGSFPSSFNARLDVTGTGTLGVVDTTDGNLSLATTSTATTLTGSQNADYLRGNTGNDILNGLNGNDTLIGGTGADTINLGTGSSTIVVAAGDTALTIGGTLNAGTVVGFDTVSNFSIGTTGTDTLDVAGTAAVVANTAGTNGVDSTLTIGGTTIKSHAITDGIITFDNTDIFAAPAVTIATQADVAAAVQYLQAQNLGGIGSTVAFQTADAAYVYTQGSADGLNDSLDTVIQLTGVTTATSVATTAAGGAILVA